MNIDTWIGSCKVRICPWVDGKRIYCNVRYYRSGQSIERDPVWDKTVYIINNERGKNLAYNFTHSLVEYIIGLTVAEGKEITLMP